MPFEVEAKLEAKVLNSPGSLLFPSCLKLILIWGKCFLFQKAKRSVKSHGNSPEFYLSI
jgi:hypothetical protein